MANSPNRVGGQLKRLADYPEHLSKIGLVITDFAHLEQQLCLTLWWLIGDAARGNAVFWSLGSSKARCDVVRGLGNEVLIKGETHAKLLAELKSCIESVRGVAEKRNDLAHGSWGKPAKGGPDPFISIQRPATKNPVFERIYTVAELQALADQIYAIERRIAALNNALHHFLQPEDQRAFSDSMRAESPELDAYLRKYE